MDLNRIKKEIPKELFEILSKDITKLRPSQEKAINKGLFENKSLLVCTPTASGKTLIGEMAAVKSILEKKGKAVYIVPLKALANEKYKEFKKRYDGLFEVGMSIGDLDKSEPWLEKYDLLLTTSEKLDSLIRHKSPWIKYFKTIIIDEVHLLNDPGRGPTLEILITLLKELIDEPQIIALSATIGNPKELATWLEAKLVTDTWRPVELKKGIYHDKKIDFY